MTGKPNTQLHRLARLVAALLDWTFWGWRYIHCNHTALFESDCPPYCLRCSRPLWGKTP